MTTPLGPEQSKPVTVGDIDSLSDPPDRNPPNVQKGGKSRLHSPLPKGIRPLTVNPLESRESNLQPGLSRTNARCIPPTSGVGATQPPTINPPRSTFSVKCIYGRDAVLQQLLHKSQIGRRERQAEAPVDALRLVDVEDCRQGAVLFVATVSENGVEIPPRKQSWLPCILTGWLD